VNRIEHRSAPREDELTAGSERVLDPVERLSEVLFGLVMAMTSTGSIQAASAGHEAPGSSLRGRASRSPPGPNPWIALENGTKVFLHALLSRVARCRVVRARPPFQLSVC